jgi:hypothetical protein
MNQSQSRAQNQVKSGQIRTTNSFNQCWWTKKGASLRHTLALAGWLHTCLPASMPAGAPEEQPK